MLHGYDIKQSHNHGINSGDGLVRTTSKRWWWRRMISVSVLKIFDQDVKGVFSRSSKKEGLSTRSLEIEMISKLSWTIVALVCM